VAPGLQAQQQESGGHHVDGGNLSDIERAQHADNILNTNDINEVHHADNTLRASDVAGAHQTDTSLNANISAAIRPSTKGDRNFSEPFPSTRTQVENNMMFSTAFPEPSSNSMPTNNIVLEHDSLPAFGPTPTLMDTGLFSFDGRSAIQDLGPP
jgi:hypothetical protein